MKRNTVHFQGLLQGNQIYGQFRNENPVQELVKDKKKLQYTLEIYIYPAFVQGVQEKSIFSRFFFNFSTSLSLTLLDIGRTQNGQQLGVT